MPAVFELRDRLGSTQVTVTTAYGERGTPQRRCWAFYRPVTSYRHGCRLRLSTFLLASHDESSGLVPGSAGRWSAGGCVAVRQCPKLHRIRYRVERLPNQGLHRCRTKLAWSTDVRSNAEASPASLTDPRRLPLQACRPALSFRDRPARKFPEFRRHRSNLVRCEQCLPVATRSRRPGTFFHRLGRRR